MTVDFSFAYTLQFHTVGLLIAGIGVSVILGS